MTVASELLDVDEAAHYLRVHRATLYRLIRRRQLKKTKVAGRTRFLRCELDRYIQRNTREAR